MALEDIFTPVFTDAGRAAVAAADGAGLDVTISELALGDAQYAVRDGNGDPLTAAVQMTALSNERLRVPLTAGAPVNDYEVLVEALVAAAAPEFWIGEVGFFLDDGTLLAIASHDTQYIGYRGSVADWTFRFVLGWTDLPASSITVTFNGDAAHAALSLDHERLENKIRHTVGDAGLTWSDTDDTQLTKAVKEVAPLPPSHRRGMQLRRLGMTVIEIAAGHARDDSDQADLLLTAAMNKDLGLAWSAGGNGGMLDTGALGGGEVYDVFAIGKTADPTALDILACISGDIPLLPAGGWDVKRLITSLLYDGTQIIPFIHAGRTVVFTWSLQSSLSGSSDRNPALGTHQIWYPSGPRRRVRMDLRGHYFYGDAGVTIRPSDYSDAHPPQAHDFYVDQRQLETGHGPAEYDARWAGVMTGPDGQLLLWINGTFWPSVIGWTELE